LASEPPDRFFSEDDGWAETRHVFLAGNGLPAAWAGRSRFVVSELGFGTGLNLLALVTLAAEERSAGRPTPALVYQSVEWSPRPPGVFLGLAGRWPGLAPAASELEAVYRPASGWNRWTLPGLEFVLFVGDARALPGQSPGFEPADAWFLDGYAPDRAPELWEPGLLAWVGRRTRPGGTVATYSAAGVVKQGLRAAGFAVSRRPGWGRKRHMVTGRLPSSPIFGSLYREDAILTQKEGWDERETNHR